MLHFCVFLIFSCISPIHGFYSSSNSWEFSFPLNIMEQLFGIEMNDSLSLRGKERAMDSVISKNIDYSQRSKLQLPPIYGGLPAVAQWQIKDVFYHPNLTFDEKHAIIEKLIRDLPLDQQINIPQNNCSSETSKQKTMFFDSFSTIVYTIRYSVPLSELKEKIPDTDFKVLYGTLKNGSLSVKQKMNDINFIMLALDSDLQQSLFQVNGPMDVEPFHKDFLNKFREELKNITKAKTTPSSPTSPASTSEVSASTRKSGIRKRPPPFGKKIEPKMAKLKELMG